MAGTVKLCVPELPDELFGVAVAFGGSVDVGAAVAVALAVAECVWLGEADADDDELAVSVGVGAADVPGMAVDAGAATDELEVLVPHAARPAPPMMTAIIAAGTRLFLMLQSSVA
jgi:hypothetical protein